MAEDSKSRDVDIVVVGAGPGGIAAARELSSKGLKVAVLEARDRVGGRLFTSQCLGMGVDLGAQWIHQFSPANPLAELLLKYKVPLRTRTGPRMWALFDGKTGKSIEWELLQEAREHATTLVTETGLIGMTIRQDKPVSEAYDHRKKQLEAEAAAEDAEKGRVFANLLNWSLREKEYFEGASFKVLSCQQWNAGGEMAGGDAPLKNGYGSFMTKLAAELDVHLCHAVSKIEYDAAGGCTVTAVAGTPPAASRPSTSVKPHAAAGAEDGGSAAGAGQGAGAGSATDAAAGFGTAATAKKKGEKVVFTCQAVVVAVPLGVLQDRAIAFEPALPQEKLDAIDRLGCSQMNKIAMAFDKPFWDASTGVIGVVSDSTYHFPWFFVQPRNKDDDPHVLLCFLACEYASVVEAWDDNKVISEALRALASGYVGPQEEKDSSSEIQSYGLPKPANYAISRWRSDPYARGSWTHYPVGSGPRDSLIVRQPVDSRVFWAGEVAYPEAQGCAHGAFMSGQLAASTILSLAKQVDAVPVADATATATDTTPAAATLPAAATATAAAAT